jgi:arylsulfatase A-like enzyme
MWLADRFAAFLQREWDKAKPFFAFVGFPDPHHPFAPCEEIAERFAEAETQTPHDPEGSGLEDYLFGGMGCQIPELAEEEKRIVIRNTYAMVYQIDLAIGRIVDTLQALGEWENTIVVFTSDHGDFLCDHGFLQKGVGAAHSLLHLPFVLRVPGVGLPRRIDTTMSNCDVMPTLAALTGVRCPPNLHGQDILAVQDAKEPHHAFTYMAYGDPALTNYTAYDDIYRYTYYPHPERLQLFDHQEDPSESRNLAPLPEHCEIVEHMQQRIERSLIQHYNPILARVSAW